MPRACTSATPLFARPDETAETLGELAEGDIFALLDITGGWAWGFRETGHLVGYVPTESLSE